MSSNPQHVVDTEDAAELNLGEDFRHETCLSNAEVAVILEKQKSDYENQEKQLTRCDMNLLVIENNNLIVSCV